MGTVEFKASQVKEVLALGTAKMAFVHDDGCYILARKGDNKDSKDFKQVVEYAIGLDPNKDPDFYEDARRAVGGDDFVEHFDRSAFEEALRQAPARAKNVKLFLEVSEDSIGIGVSWGKGA